VTTPFTKFSINICGKKLQLAQLAWQTGTHLLWAQGPSAILKTPAARTHLSEPRL